MPASNLKKLGVNTDLTVVEEEVNRTVGGRLTQLEQISRDPWMLETILGSRLEISDRPHQRKELTQVPLSKEKAKALDEELGTSISS